MTSWANTRVKLHSQVHFGSKTTFGHKENWVQNSFGFKQIWGPKMFGPKILNPKKLWVQKFVGPQ